MPGPPELRRRCEALRALHVPGRPLVLPNAWDVASARAVVAAGFPIVATTSGGVAASLGYEDHERAPAGEMLAAAGRIAHSVEVPVTVDAEAGYGMAPDALVDALLDVGAAGCNLEDTDHATGSLVDPSRHAVWLASCREAAERRGYDLVLNARIDVFLAHGNADAQLELAEEALARAHAYRSAGADCVYPIALRDRDAIARFVRGAGAPVNILASSAAPPIPELAELGVARVSYGSSLHVGVMEELEAFLAGRRDRLGRAATPPRST